MRYKELEQEEPYWEIDADSCNKILSLKQKNCFRDEYSSLITTNLWLDYFLLNHKPGLGSLVIQYPPDVANHTDFDYFINLFHEFTITSDDEYENNCVNEKIIFKVQEDASVLKIKKRYITQYETVIVLQECNNSSLKSNLILEIINDSLFLRSLAGEMIPVKSILTLKPPTKLYQNISGYDFNGKFHYDIESYMRSKDESVLKLWDYYSFFIKDELMLDDIKSLKNIYSETRLKIMLKDDFFNVDLNQISVFIKNSFNQQTINLLPKKPKNLTDLENNLMLLQLTNHCFVDYSLPDKVVRLSGSKFKHYEIFIPKNRKDLIMVSKLMKNCLFEAQWDIKLLHNKEFILILLNNNKPEIIISFDEFGDITDSAGKCNVEVEPELVKEIQKTIIPSI